ncbi:MAG: hypothetical protein II493_04420, partial [Spirochaetales bacterium]|nr:hypothetical protein [Spirochaetales bacterium]
DARLCRRLSDDSFRLDALTKNLEDALTGAPTLMNLGAAGYYHDSVLSVMEELKVVINDAEKLTPQKYWPYPTYSQLLFSIQE